MSKEEIIDVFNTIISANKFSGVYTDIGIIIEAMKGLLDLYNKEKEKNECLRDNLNHSIRTSVIKEALGLEGDITEEEILNYIDILVSENNRLEDIEDKKVQIEYQNVFNKGVKSVEKKIQEKIEEYNKLQEEMTTKNHNADNINDCYKYGDKAQKAYYKKEALQELLEERN